MAYDDHELSFNDFHGTLEVNIGCEERPVRIQTGYKPVEIDKAFGPTSFAPLRITPVNDNDFCGWVVARQWLADGSWREVIRIEGQIEEEYAEADANSD